MSAWGARLKKWWWVIALALGAAVLAVLRLLCDKGGEKAKGAEQVVQETREKVRDADTQVLIEKEKAKAETAEKRGALAEVEKIPDGRLRRQRLAELLGTELP